jgi:hypothetical protein
MIEKLIFYKSIVKILYNLKNQDLNPKKLEKTLDFETKDRDAIVLGNGYSQKYVKFKMTVNPVVNLLDKNK